MKKFIITAAAVVLATIGVRVQAAEELAPLPITTPIPAFMGTPTEIPDDEHLEKPSDKDRPAFMAPKGCENLALKKKVTGSVEEPINGSYDLVTDGDKEFNDDSYLELPRKTQWVQIDLEQSYPLYAVVVWHCHNTPQIYRDVIVLLSDDPEFKKDVITLYNNDYDNSSKLGELKGREYDKEYFENHEGRLIDCKGQKGRYIRLYSRGSSYSSMNRYVEVEAWGLKK